MTLRTRLDELAADAPDAAALDLDRLRSRIARRRRGRLAGSGAAVVLLAVASSVAATGLLDQDPPPPLAGQASPTPSGLPTVEKWPPPGPQQAFSALGCSMPIRSPGSGVAPDPNLELDVRLESPLDPGDDAVIGTATVTNTGAVPIGGSDSLDVWIAKDETVVTDPPPVTAEGHSIELAPGQSLSFPVLSFARRCVSSEPSQPGQRPLEPGIYQVYIQLRLLDLDGTRTSAYAGPIDVEVR